MGIICLETEWEHTIKQNRLSLHTRSLLGFLEKSWGCKVIYRRVATKGELQYYLRRFATSEYNDYSIFYLSFHGDTHSIFLEGEKKTEKKLTLKELADMAKGVFTDRFVHFSSCRTLLGSDKELEEFKNNTGALYPSAGTTNGGVGGNWVGTSYRLNFDASRVVPTSDEVRPYSMRVLYLIAY